MSKLRTWMMSCLLLVFSARLFAVGWTPTDGGLVVDLEQGDRFLLSVWVDKNGNGTEEDGEEFFVSNYTRYTGGYYNYGPGTYMKLIPQAAGATEPSEMTVWTVGAPLSRVIGGKNYDLGGIVYTIWNDGKTLKTFDDFKFLGDLTSDYNNSKAVDVVFVAPTDQARRTSFDPNMTLKSIYGRDDQAADGKINGKIGKGFLGMTYREVYMLDIPKQNHPISYTNAALVTFNTRDKQQSWSQGQIKCDPGHAAYAYADNKHKQTHRTLFRLYLLDEPLHYCDSYYFATDEQDYKNYRSTRDLPGDSTAKKKIYTIDWMTPMTAVDKASSKLYKTDYMYVPVPDSTYYYVGYNNDYKDSANPSDKMGNPGAFSQFEKIRDLPLATMPTFKAPAGAYGKMVVDTSSTEYNLDVKFEPAGYFMKIKETGKNIRLHYTGDNKWTCEEMWTISGYYASLHIRTMLMTGPDFREDDPGAPVEGWSKWVRGDSVPVSDGTSIVDKSGYAQITINNTDSNGHMVFILADNTKWIRYDNNGFTGLEMPLQYPLSGGNTVTLMAPRIKPEYTFEGWDTQADGNGTRYNIGDTYTFSGDGEVKLYAQARYDGTLQVALSFINPSDSKRYFITHPNSSAPRYASARHFEEWANTWQGMENAENLDPNYVSTFEVRCPVAKVKKKDGDIPDLLPQEHVLDPRSYTMKGYEDSLTFYEFFHPADDEYLGLYYQTPGTMLANNTWAGLFTTTSDATPISWPTYKTPYITGVKLKSERYVQEYDPENKPDSLILKVRSNSDKPYVKYNTEDDQFDGVATAGEATTFDISAVVVADAHYIVLPDSSHAWQDTITFGYHYNEQTREEVWSSLIGKQLLACMIVGGDTTYFHPNRNKIINDPNNLYLSPDFRVSQVLELIRDSRVSAPLSVGDSVQHETTDYHWHNNIVSGMSSPLNVTDGSGNYIDIVDTFRITVSHGGISKIKEYRGLWHKDAPGLHVNPDGSRYRDVIIKTKTYHEGAETTRLILEPEYESYQFSPLAGISKTINFNLIRETSRSMLDKDNNPVSTRIIARDTIKNTLALTTSTCSLKGDAFDKGTVETNHVTLSTRAENVDGVNYDTLTVTIASITVDAVTYTDVTARVPLIQAALTSHELLWSVVDNGRRYFILAKEDGFVFRQYSQKNNILYKLNTTTHLVKGTANDANNDTKYITPWEYAATGTPNQLTLQAHLTTVNPYFKVTGSTPGVDPSSSSALTYEIVASYTNSNANYEEQVKLQYGGLDNGWLRFRNGALELTTYANASTFSWSYLVQEYSLLNNGTYPNRDFVQFGYNDKSSLSVQTRYKAYKEYSTLLNNSVTYLCREEESDVANLRDPSKEWLTDMSFTLVRDSRFGAEKDSSKLAITPDYPTLTTTVSTDKDSPLETKYGGEYVNIVDTLDVRLTLQSGAPAYRFKGDWSSYKSVDDARLKIPLIRKTYHTAPYDSLSVSVDGEHYSYIFPAEIVVNENDTFEFVLNTYNRTGTHVLNVEGQSVESSGTSTDVTTLMDFTNKNMSEIRLVDEYGNKPDWCEIKRKTAHTIIVRCTKNGIRSPRAAYLYLAYIVTIGGKMRFVNYRLTVGQASSFTYANNQRLVHTNGASGDEMMANGMQQVHENKRILYYYPEQDVELPVRERAFYGWWRWYREGKDVNGVDVSDTDIPDSLWRQLPQNTGKYNFPFRIIGDRDSTWIDEEDHDKGKRLVRMGRYTVFHYKSKDYGNKLDPPSKNPRVAPPITTYGAATKPTLTYAVDISNYYDNLPMSVSHKNQVDTAMLDTIKEIIEPTLSLREVFELHPWTEMAAKLEDYKDPIASPCTNLNYMEDHVMMAPIGARLLLQTEQRYRYDHLAKTGHSESLLGYYMRDDNWSTGGWNDERKDTMIWCGGWDADCEWYTYDPHAAVGERYQPCTHSITESDDFLQVPAKSSITAGNAFDTVYYCLRARSQSTTGTPGVDEETEDGLYMFNICRYMIIYHNPKVYGPLVETKTAEGDKAIIPNQEIEERYEVLERLDFDYVKPGSGYHVYPHPLPWADASYGYTYPETSDLPHNRYHDESDFPNHGEYGLINRIPYSTYWHKMEQHGGAVNGYMIYCDGMASAGQVAALSLETHLCAGQKMFFSGYVGNPSSQKNKSNPNFIFSVQGMTDAIGAGWEDITSYMTGDIQPSDKWYQIYFPIIHNEGGKEYTHFRVRIYNLSNSFDGNDFIIDDMCIFATKPPLIAYQANTTCKVFGEDAAETHVILRIDYQGITGDGYNGENVCYTVQQHNKKEDTYSFVPMTDHYLQEETKTHIAPSTVDTVFGKIYIPARDYEPQDEDSIYRNMNLLIYRFDHTDGESKVREGYIYEILEGEVRPVKYVVHTARLNPDNEFSVHMSADYKELLSSICGMTSRLKVSNRMVLNLNGVEQPEVEHIGLCANSTYDISLSVKGPVYRDSVAPNIVTGSCVNDWLLYGDTARESSKKRYGYYYKDIVKVISNILRYAPMTDEEENANQFAPSLASVDKAEMDRVYADLSGIKGTAEDLTPGVDPYELVADLVNNGFLLMYKPRMTTSVFTGDSVQFVILPIVGSGSEEVAAANVEVCPNPIFIELKPNSVGGVPIMIGGLNRDSTEKALPVNVLASERAANTQFKLRVDSIMDKVGIYSIDLRSTDDPDFREGVHILHLQPDIAYPTEDYYLKGDSIILRPSSSNNYTMKAGYNYTFNIVMQTWSGSLHVDPENPTSCEVGTVPFTLSIVPDYVRWNPKSSSSNNWNDADNWLGINEKNEPIHEDAHFVPMEHTYVLIPAPGEGKPYPVVQPLPAVHADSIQKVGFQYNQHNTIRFLPGAAIGQQQYINHADVVVDMQLPQQKWAFRTAPVKGMVSGDIFMANADNNGETPLWEVGEFDASGRSYKTGNASFWLSVYNRETNKVNHTGEDSVRTAAADWSKVTNAMDMPLPVGQGFAVYARSKSGIPAVVRLPKNDDTYYYYGTYGERIDDKYVPYLQTLRNTLAGGLAGELAFQPEEGHDSIKLKNEVASESFVFGNLTMGYIDIWGFIADNTGVGTAGLIEKFGYMNEEAKASIYSEVTEVVAASGTDEITNLKRYLPPMHVMILTAAKADTILKLRLNTNRVVTDVSQVVRPAPAPRRAVSARRPGIMTVTAKNPASARCTSYLLLGQGYHNAILDGEDAVLTTINIDNYTANLTPTTPFNLYAVEQGNGMSINLRDSIVNVPISFYMSDLEFEPVTQLWFTGVNNIDDQIVLYDALTDTERKIIDGICLTIETPEQNHERRYYIRRMGYSQENIATPIPTGMDFIGTEGEQAIKFIKDGLVYIWRNGHIYTIFGQKVR